MNEEIRPTWGDRAFSSEYAESGFFPCVYHVAANKWNGLPICAACVQEGRIIPPDPTAPEPQKPEAEVEFDRVVEARLSLEREKEELRRAQIDFAVRSGDAAGAARLGAGSSAVEAASTRIPPRSGVPEHPALPGGEVPVGPRRLYAALRDGQDVGGAAQGAGPQPLPLVPLQERLAVVPDDAAVVEDEPYRVLGVDWP